MKTFRVRGVTYSRDPGPFSLHQTPLLLFCVHVSRMGLTVKDTIPSRNSPAEQNFLFPRLVEL